MDQENIAIEQNPFDLLTEAQVAQAFNRSPRTLARMRARREGPPFLAMNAGRGRRVGAILYRRQAVEKWIESQEITPVRSKRARKAS